MILLIIRLHGGRHVAMNKIELVFGGRYLKGFAGGYRFVTVGSHARSVNYSNKQIYKQLTILFSR